MLAHHLGEKDKSAIFVSSQNAKQKERCLEEGRQVELPARPASVGASREEGSGTNMSNLCSALDSCKKKKKRWKSHRPIVQELII